jgi:glycosyltransferase involved in cell wall biosynthesis
VVTSSVASRGIDAQPGRHLYVEDDPSAFASRVVALLASPADRLAMGRHARAFVEAHHAWDRSYARLDALLRSTVATQSHSVCTPA